jgi:hypothetical protein
VSIRAVLLLVTAGAAAGASGERSHFPGPGAQWERREAGCDGRPVVGAVAYGLVEQPSPASV